MPAPNARSLVGARLGVAARFGRHGEKGAYGRDFTAVEREPHRFPGIPTTDTSAAGGHDRGTRPRPG